MMARAGTGWQTTLADLSLILFMVTAAAVSKPEPAPGGGAQAPVLGEPVAVWREAPGGPGLNAWLAAQPPDPRRRLTIFAAPDAAGNAARLARGSGGPARVVLEPGLGSAPFATLTYDRQQQLARGLLKPDR